MKMHLERSGQNLISHYGIGEICINQQRFDSNILVMQTCIVEHWFSGDITTLTLEHFAPLLNTHEVETPEIVLLGTGEKHVFPDFSLLAGLKEQGIALEVMNTRAACRTYSVLVSEQRSVAAALIQIGPEQ